MTVANLYDKRATLMVLGALVQRPEYLGAPEFSLSADDFEEKFHKIIYSAMYNLYYQGAMAKEPIAIDNYLCNYDVQYKIFQENDGLQYLENARDMTDLSNFDYYYIRLKKFSALRYLARSGHDVSAVYDDNIVSPKQREEMQARFDEMSLVDIFGILEKDFLEIKDKYLQNIGGKEELAGEGLEELKESLKITPEIGLPFQGELFNAVTRGARLTKLYMRSGASGTGKTRMSVGDGARIACKEWYDLNKQKWVPLGAGEPVLFITTELELDEIKTQLLAFISGVSEDAILNGDYRGDQEARVDYAIKVIKESPFYINFLPNYSPTEIMETTRRFHLTKGVKYIFFDYIHTTVKMLQDLAQQSKGMKLREDQVLAMVVAQLKDLCNELQVHIFTGSQLNSEWENKEVANQNLLRGAKAMADKLDVGAISLPVKEDDKTMLKPLVQKLGCQEPNIVTTMYKIRRGRWMGCKIWSYVDLGTCRVTDLFATDNLYNPLPIEPLVIEVRKQNNEFLLDF